MNDHQIPKTFDPAELESRWYAHWEGEGRFRPDRPGAEPWTLVNPPPNVTGNLHIGHALDNTLQDVLVRHARMSGRDAKWVVGTDHAGIATQMVVERQLNAQQQKRTDFTREEFVEKVWAWKRESGGNITRQLRRLGCSMDWSNEQFTMDPHFADAVTKVFVDLYNDGLIYRDKRLVNWDSALRTAISDLEVESRDVQGHMWHFKYPLAGGETYTYVERDADGNVTLQEERDYISIATTRPETMLGDGAVAVHPDDPRYAPLVGKFCEIPVGPKEHRRLIPIITDDYPDPDFGSGAVKITGAHDENDYGVAQRNGIPMYRLMDEVAAMRTDGVPYAEASARARELAGGADFDAREVDALNLVPDEYRGLDRYDARTRVVADIDAEGLMIRVEDKAIVQPFGDRGGVVIEPMLTDQWYVDAEKLAQAPIAAVRSGDINVVPKSWEKTFFNWMENIQPWCVSRQLWWGHRIPAWYDEDGKAYVALTEEEARQQAGGAELRRDEDVLDTWFSSALWPFATQGWPDTDVKGEGRYPNDVLVSGFDILFFWDARMMMMGMHLLGDVPFRDLYLHGLVRAADGQKMSKSKGNTVDPIGLIDKYGADALRFFMTAMESQGRDIKMDEARIEGYRNFATKLWNAARFAQGYGIGASESVSPPAATTAVNKWIVGEVIKTAQAVDLALADYRFDAYADTVYHFAWNRFCDWYLELIKPVMQTADGEPEHADAGETRAVAGWVLDQILVMLHPAMPFVTEELWHRLGERPYDLILAKWVEADSRAIDVDAARQVNDLIELVTSIRGTRAGLDVPAGAILPLQHDGDAPSNLAALQRLARVEAKAVETLPSSGGVRIAVAGREYFLELAGVDIAAVKARYDKRIAATGKEIAGIEARLSNPKFRERAPAEVVAESQAKVEELTAERVRLEEALSRLG